MASTTFLRFLALLRLSSAHRDPILVPVPVILSPFPSPLLSSLPSPFPSSFPPRPRSRPRSHHALLRSPPPPFPLPLRPRPHDRSRPRSHPRPRYRLQSRPRPRSLLPVTRTRLPPRYDTLVQTPGLANGAVGCSQAPPPVCRDGDACGIKMPAVKQKRIAAEDVLLPSLPPDVGTRWSVSDLCSTRLMASSLMRASCTSEPTSPQVCVSVCAHNRAISSHSMPQYSHWSSQGGSMIGVPLIRRDSGDKLSLLVVCVCVSCVYLLNCTQPRNPALSS